SAPLCSDRLLERQGQCVGSLWTVAFATGAFGVGGALVGGLAFGAAFIGIKIVLFIICGVFGLSASAIALDTLWAVALVGSAIGTVVGGVGGFYASIVALSDAHGDPRQAIEDLFPSPPSYAAPAPATGPALAYFLISGGVISVIGGLCVVGVVFVLVAVVY